MPKNLLKLVEQNQAKSSRINKKPDVDEEISNRLKKLSEPKSQKGKSKIKNLNYLIAIL